MNSVFMPLSCKDPAYVPVKIKEPGLCSSAPCDHDNVITEMVLSQQLPEYLSQSPSDPVSCNRIADLSAYHKPEPALLEAIGINVEDQVTGRKF